MRISALKRLVLAAAVVAGFGTSANALNLTWTGSGVIGSDPLGHPWTLRSDSGTNFWGIPGIGLGVVPFCPACPPTDWVTDFHITFHDLPQGVEIIENGPETVGGFTLATRFNNDSQSVLWPRMIMGNTVWFVASSNADRLDPGENFFVNVAFSGPVSAVNFTAEWTMDVPEPATLAIFGLGLAAIGAMRRRRSA